MKTIDDVLKNKPLGVLDKVLRFFGYFIMITIDEDTRDILGWSINKFKK